MASFSHESLPLLPIKNKSNNDSLKGFSFLIALAFSINFSMGAGFLSLPWAFNQSGLLLSFLVMLIVSIPLYIAILFNLETMARANIIDHLIKSPNFKFYTTTNTPTPTMISNDINVNNLLLVGEERYEVSDLCSIFIGKWTKLLFLFFISIYSYGCLWSYCAVFSRALASTFPLGDEIDSYVIYLILYALIVIPLTCMEVTEQIYVQVFLAFCRLAVVIFMVGTAIFGFISNSELFDERIDYYSNTTHLFNWNSIHIILPIATFAFIFTHNVPVISEPVDDKSKLHWIYLATVFICFLGYCSIGIMVSIYFGDDIQSSCNLNWSTPSNKHSSSVLYRLISLYIVIFPALDVVSAFPLNAITLGKASTLFYIISLISSFILHFL